MVDEAALPTWAIIAGFTALGGAVAWLAHRWDAGNIRCEERSNALQKELKEMRDWSQGEMLQTLRQNAEASRAVVDSLRKLRYEVRELDPSDVIKDESESDILTAVTGKRNEDDTTKILRVVR